MTDECDQDVETAGAGENFGARTIGFWGGVMLLINNVAGPTVSLMPSLAQEAGWLAMILAEVLIATVSALCGFLLLSTVRSMPGNETFRERVEYTDVVRYFLPNPWYALVMLSYYAYLSMTLMTYIIQTSQVMDYVFLDAVGCAYGLRFWPSPGIMCGDDSTSSTPFGDATVLSASFVVVALVCAPCASKNLDDNIALQWFAIIGLTVLAVLWLVVLTDMPHFPTSIPPATTSQSNLVGTLLFNFAFMSALPSWANEKKPEVSVSASFVTSLSYVVVVYSVIGVVGGMAFHPYYQTDNNMFSKFNSSGNQLARMTVILYPILQNFTSIPVFSILIKYNLIQTGWFQPRMATILSIGLPWLLSVPFYTGKGFATVSDWGGMLTSSVINFIVPLVLFCRSRGTSEYSEVISSDERSHSDSSEEESSVLLRTDPC